MSMTGEEHRHDGHEHHREHDHHHGGHHHHERIIHYTVDGEPQETDKHVLTPREILGNAGLDPSQYYLVLQRHGHTEVSYKDKPDEPIHMHEHMEFLAIFTGPMPVS